MPALREVQIVAEGLAFPEGPVVRSDGSVLVAEIGGGSIARVDRDGRVERIAFVGGGPNGAAIGPDGALYVCNNGGFRDGSRIAPCIQRVDLTSGAHEVLYRECDGVALGSPNDLVFDDRGCFYFTDHIASGSIYYAKPDGSAITTIATGRPHPNGIGLSPDRSVLYWAETPTRQVQRRRIVAPGSVTPGECDVRALFRPGGADRFAVLAGLPGCHELDSLAIDSAGSVVVGTLVDSGVSEIRVDGSWTLHTLPAAFADPLVTNVCFGGDDFATLYITCSRTGRLLRATWHCPGAPLAFAS
jgi:gluconolactonase